MMYRFKLIIARRVDFISCFDGHAQYAFAKRRDRGEGKKRWTYMLDGWFVCIASDARRRGLGSIVWFVRSGSRGRMNFRSSDGGGGGNDSLWRVDRRSSDGGGDVIDAVVSMCRLGSGVID